MKAVVGRAQSAHLALLAGLLVLGIVSAGCIGQDRPHQGAFSVVADAGKAQVLAAGETAHLSFPENRTIEAQPGEAPNEEVAISWRASWGPTGTLGEFNASPPSEGLSIVELNVTARNHTASDAVGLLVVPDGSAGLLRIQIGVVGEAGLEDLGGSPALSKAGVKAGAHEGGSYGAAFPSSGAARYHLVARANASAPEVVLLIAAKAGLTTVYENASLPFALDAARNYTLVVDTTAAQQHRVEVRDAAGALVESLSLDAFAAAHPGAAYARVLVPAPAQTLPGFEAAAVPGGLLVVALGARVRRG